MKSLKEYLPEAFLAELADPGPADSISPVNGGMVGNQPDPHEMGIKENAEELNIGDPVKITGNVEFNGTTGEICDFGQNKSFVVVNLYNHGKHSFHSSDVEFNDYADSDEEEARAYDSDPDARNWTHESTELANIKRLAGI